MDLFIIIVRIFHIFGGMFWLGTVWMTAIFLGPTSEAIGSDAEKFMTYITVKLRYPVVVSIAAGSNVLAGILLYWKDSAGLRLEWITTPTGLGFSFGAICAITGFVLGFGVVRPTAEKLAGIGKALHAQAVRPRASRLPSCMRCSDSWNGRKSWSRWCWVWRCWAWRRHAICRAGARGDGRA